MTIAMLFPSKNFRTIVTHELFTLFRVHEHFVIIHFLPVFKCRITQITCGGFWAGIMNVLDMINQVLLSVKSFGTFIAMVISFASMSQDVIFKLGAICKGFATLFANMMTKLFSFVNVFDMLQILLFQSIKFATVLTFEVFLFFVNLHDVVLEMLLRKFFATNMTWFHISVHNSDMRFPFFPAVIQFSTIFALKGGLNQIGMRFSHMTFK